MTLHAKTFPVCGCVLILCLITKVGSTCPSNLTSFKFVRETEKDVVLVNTSSSSTTTWSFSIASVSSEPPTTTNLTYFRDFFTIIDDNVTFVVNLSKELDLELLYQEFSVVIQRCTFQLQCKEISEARVDYNVVINVSPVNEFLPTFKFEPYEVFIPENTSVGTTIYSFKNITDDDIPTETLEYGTRDWSDGKVDASKRFLTLPFGRIPDIALSSKVDYDHLASNSLPTTYFLLFEVNDGLHTSTTTLTVHISDVDDLPPTFLPPCASPNCIVQYEADTTADYKGTLSVKPQRITAKDQDTLNYSISYSIDSSRYSSGFTIDPRNGVLTKTNITTQTGILTIRAQEEQGLNQTTVANVLIKILDPNSIPQAQKSTVAENDDTFKYVMIAIAVILAIVIAALVAFVIFAKKKLKMSRVDVENSNSPNTSRETLSHSDGGGDTPKDSFQTTEISTNVIPLDVTPKGRNNLLPPLKPKKSKADKATEAKLKKKKKKKNKTFLQRSVEEDHEEGEYPNTSEKDERILID